VGLCYYVEQSSVLSTKQAIIRVIKSRSMRLANQKARMSQRRNSHWVPLVTPMFGIVVCRQENVAMHFVEVVAVHCRLSSSFDGIF
jgi:hypothetical protein